MRRNYVTGLLQLVVKLCKYIKRYEATINAAFEAFGGSADVIGERKAALQAVLSACEVLEVLVKPREVN